MLETRAENTNEAMAWHSKQQAAMRWQRIANEMPKITMMTSVSNEFPRSKNSIASKKNWKISGKCSRKSAGAKKCCYNCQWRKMIPKVEN
jgi:hypothetical protein